MATLSASFTLGRASKPNSANIEHNNREYVAENVDVERIKNNIIYEQQKVQDAYNLLFGEAVLEYNATQKRADRKITDYYEHIKNGKREEAFYEIIVQFGDITTAPVGSKNGELAKRMLDEYMNGFAERNKNLHVFNAVLHMDESSPHLHINVIPFYTAPRKNGLKKGVSMKAALDEQGFDGTNKKDNRLVAWEASEFAELERILNRHDLERNIKNATHKHMTVDEYKQIQGEKKITATLQSSQNWKQCDDVEELQRENYLLQIEKAKLEKQAHSPWKSFYYSSPDKQAFVQSKLDELRISFRECENGFEVQECYVQQIRDIEKQFKPVPTSHREVLRNSLDKFTMQSQSFDEVLKRLEGVGYTVKQGTYIAVKPKNSNQFLRLKSLGEDYSEQALRDRITERKKQESEINSKIKTTANPLAAAIYGTIQHYTIVFAKGALPVRKVDKKKPLTWHNDVEINTLVALGKKVQLGITAQCLRDEFTCYEESIAKKDEQIAKLKSDIKVYNDVLQKGVRCFERGEGSESDLKYLRENNITANNFKRLEQHIAIAEVELSQAEESLAVSQTKLKEASELLTAFEKIESRTYVQGLVKLERQRREADVEIVPQNRKR